MLERKYGGVKARNAALTIQRAFRHYTLLKKFAAITAMAKAEKRLSRRMVGFTEETNNENHSHRLQLDGYLPPGPPSMPLRSMSMRERRHTGVTNTPTSNNILPRSHSGRCDLNYFCDVPHTLYYAPQDIYMDMSKVSFLLGNNHKQKLLYNFKSFNIILFNIGPYFASLSLKSIR